MSLLLFDPVPGDLLTVAQLDLLGLTNTFASKDLSNCLCLSRVLALYPYEPLPAILCHAPVLCRYPTHCMVEEEVTLGCHQGALMTFGLQGPHIDLASSLCFLQLNPVGIMSDFGSSTFIMPLFHSISKQICWLSFHPPLIEDPYDVLSARSLHGTRNYRVPHCSI